MVNSTMNIKLDSINLFVTEMNKTLSFYKILGLDFSEDDYSKDYVKKEYNSVALCFYTKKIVKDFFEELDISNSLNSNYELSFRVEMQEEVDSIYSKLMNKGYVSVKKPENSSWNQRVAFVNDPDHNLIEICAFLK